MNGLKQAALAIAASLAFAGPALAAEEAHSHGHAATEAKLVLNHGQKWPTDAPLRQGMESIRAAVAKDVDAIHAGKATPGQYKALAERISQEVAGIVQNCKLDPEADAQLHLVIAELMAGAEAMDGAAKSDAALQGAERVAKALNTYGEYFDHAGWKRL